ncbi:helix-turn-helix transcriptional regulator [Alterluteimonas muca]|uniref:helix-turn-helix transcriptional regulator n=1 Tax=Alterluteimonas muca TaxID=2878684 RepID=UPI0031C295EF|nr:helix-turn-helix domain-containing protein [Luteimonas sp. MHLX1A]
MRITERAGGAEWAAGDAVEAVGRALADARKRRRLTQAQLAALAGVSRLTVVRAEAGHPGLALSALLSLVSALEAGMLREIIAVLESDPAGRELEQARIRLPERVRAERGRGAK